MVRVIEPLSRRASFAARERDLPHQLAAQAEFVVGVGQVGEGLERRIAGAGDHRVDVPDPLEQGADRRRIVESDLHLAVARGADDLMPFERERLYDLAADGAGRSDDDDFHGFAFRCACAVRGPRGFDGGQIWDGPAHLASRQGPADPVGVASALDGTVTLRCREREASATQELSGLCDRVPPRGHRRAAKLRWPSVQIPSAQRSPCAGRGARGGINWSLERKPPSKGGVFITPATASRVRAFAIGRATPMEDQ